MTVYVVLSRVTPGACREPGDFRKVVETVVARIREDCPDITFKDSYATLGRFDFVDVIASDDPEQVKKAIMIMRACGQSETETLVATPFQEFLAGL